MGHTKFAGPRDEMVQQGKWFRDERVPHSHAKPKVPTTGDQPRTSIPSSVSYWFKTFCASEKMPRTVVFGSLRVRSLGRAVVRQNVAHWMFVRRMSRRIVCGS